MEAVKMKAKTGAELLLEAQEQLAKEYGVKPNIDVWFHRCTKLKAGTIVKSVADQFNATCEEKTYQDSGWFYTKSMDKVDRVEIHAHFR